MDAGTFRNQRRQFARQRRAVDIGKVSTGGPAGGRACLDGVCRLKPPKRQSALGMGRVVMLMPLQCATASSSIRAKAVPGSGRPAMIACASSAVTSAGSTSLATTSLAGRPGLLQSVTTRAEVGKIRPAQSGPTSSRTPSDSYCSGLRHPRTAICEAPLAWLSRVCTVNSREKRAIFALRALSVSLHRRRE
jgi:hypothetical protein